MKQKYLLTQNTKMKKSSDKIFNFGIPAYKSNTGLKTCPFAGTCAKGCYAQMSSYTWKPVKNAYEFRLAQTLKDDFVNVLDSEIKKRKIKKIRIHDSGDFYSREYLNKWLKIIDLNPDTMFYAYTKSIPLFKAISSLPKNFEIIYSYGGLKDNMIDVNKDKHARVFLNENDLKSSGYLDCSNDDNLIFNTNKVGLVYHGYNKGQVAWE
jgi:hypothetical protein